MKLNQGKNLLPFVKENTNGLLKRRILSQLDPSSELLERILNDPQTWKPQRNVTRRRESQCCWQNALPVPVSEECRYYWQSQWHPVAHTSWPMSPGQTSKLLRKRGKRSTPFINHLVCVCVHVCVIRMLQKLFLFLKSNTLSKRKISSVCNHFKIITWFCTQKSKVFAWYEHWWCFLSGVNTPRFAALTQVYWYPLSCSVALCLFISVSA